MNRKVLSLVFLVLLTLTFPLTGCQRQASPNLEDLPDPGDEILTDEEGMMQEAEDEPGVTSPLVGDVTPVVEEPTEEIVEEPTEEFTPEPTEEPTVIIIEEPIEEFTPEPTPIPVETEEPVATAPPATPRTETGPVRHVVQPGENLFRIAMRYNTSVQAISRVNAITNPALIYVGQSLVIPSDGTGVPDMPPPTGGDIVHVVQSGENLFRIALRYNYDYYYLARYNNITNPSLVYVGQRILIPRVNP